MGKTLTFLQALYLLNFTSPANAQTTEPLNVKGKITTTNGPIRELSGAEVRIVNPEYNLDGADTTDVNGDYDINTTVTDIENNNINIPTRYGLKFGPNPFNPHTNFFINLTKHQQGSIKIFDIRGALVKDLYNGDLSTGQNQITWDATNDNDQRVANGIYFFYFQGEEFQQTGKVIYMANPSGHGKPAQQQTKSQNRLNKPAGVITADVHINTNNDSLDNVVLEDQTFTTGIQEIRDYEVPYNPVPPKWDTQPSDLVFDEGNTAYTAVLDNLASDFNLDQLTYSLKNLPAGFSWDYDGERINITPADENYNGVLDNLVLTVSDGEHSKDSDPFRLTYNNINDAPIVGNIPDQNLDRGGSVVIDLNPYVDDPDNTDQEMTWTADGYDTDDVRVTINGAQALIEALGSGNHNINFKATDPNGLYDEDLSRLVIQYIAMLNARVIAAVTDDEPLPNIPVKIGGVIYNSDNKGYVTLPFRTGVRQLIEVDSNAVTHGFQWPVTYNREQDGNLTDILLLGSAADYNLYRDTDMADIPGDGLGSLYKNWVFQHNNITYILVNPPSPEFEEAARDRLTNDMNQLDLKGRQTYTYLETIIDTTTPENLLEDVYSRGNYADIAIIWRSIGGPSGLSRVELDSLGRALWGQYR